MDGKKPRHLSSTLLRPRNGLVPIMLKSLFPASTAFPIWVIYDFGPLDYCQDRSVVVAIRRASASSALENFQKGVKLPLRPAGCIIWEAGALLVSCGFQQSLYYQCISYESHQIVEMIFTYFGK